MQWPEGAEGSLFPNEILMKIYSYLSEGFLMYLRTLSKNDRAICNTLLEERNKDKKHTRTVRLYRDGKYYRVSKANIDSQIFASAWFNNKKLFDKTIAYAQGNGLVISLLSTIKAAYHSGNEEIIEIVNMLHDYAPPHNPRNSYRLSSELVDIISYALEGAAMACNDYSVMIYHNNKQYLDPDFVSALVGRCEDNKLELCFKANQLLDPI